ncbi:tubulin beta-8 chain-like [Chironomus tepperi]|uniref:tubulin beta-8 chain-like n=1 Tax=Chironomus tepperi TaxID=113505 RepID=UPI00391EFBDB
MREIVFIQMGQCGNKIAEKFWEKISNEHYINQCGHFYGDSILPYQRLNIYFQCAQDCRFVPRCVAVDLEPTQISELKCSPVGRLFNPEYMIAGKHGAGNNFSKGHYTEGAELIECVLEKCRLQAENCDLLQGFQMVHSIGGGTGSGMGSLAMKCLRNEYEDRVINTFSIIPSAKVSQVVTEPYNAILGISELVFTADELIMFDNEALYDISMASLQLPKPNHCDLNSLISKTMAGVTTCFRYPGQLNTDLRKIMTNMCPYPRLKFFIPGYAPLDSAHNNLEYKKVTVKSIVQQLFSPDFRMADFECHDEKLLTCAAIFRGRVSSRDVEEAMVDLQHCRKEMFARFIPNNIKTAICDVPPREVDMSATLLSNTSAITVIFRRLIEQFDRMFEKRAFMHWYTGEGMEEEEFRRARNIVCDICDEYYETCQFDCDEDCCSDESECYDACD